MQEFKTNQEIYNENRVSTGARDSSESGQVVSESPSEVF